MNAEQLARRADAIVQKCIAQMPVSEIAGRVRWIEEHGDAGAVIYFRGTSAEIHWGGSRVAIVPEELLYSDTPIAVLGVLPDVPDDISDLTTPGGTHE